MSYFPTPSAPPGSQAQHPRRPWWKRWWAWTAIGALVALGVTAGIAAPKLMNSSHTEAVGSGYLAAVRTTLVFVQWTDTAGHLSGTVHAATSSGVAPTRTITSRTISVAGRVSGSTISLRFTFGPEQFGRFTGSAFTINFPEGGGALIPVTFHAVTTGEYDQQVGRLQARIAKANAQARRQQEILTDEGRVDHALHALDTALTELTTISARLPGLVAAVRTALTTESAALTQTRDALAAASSTNTTTGVCTAADVVQTDANAVRTAADSVRTAVNSIASYLTTTSTSGLHQVIGEVTPDVVDLHNAEQAVPQYRPPLVPSATSIRQDVTTATGAGASAVAAVNALITSANGDMAAADAAAAQALAAHSCGSAPSPTHLTPLSW